MKNNNFIFFYIYNNDAKHVTSLKIIKHYEKFYIFTWETNGFNIFNKHDICQPLILYKEISVKELIYILVNDIIYKILKKSNIEYKKPFEKNLLLELKNLINEFNNDEKNINDYIDIIIDFNNKIC